MKNVVKLLDGSLVRAEGPYVVVRQNYAHHHRDIKDTHDMRATLRAGRYTSMGSYPLYFITSDGGCLCYTCARTEYRAISQSIRAKSGDGWRVTHCDVNYETRIDCDHCTEQIESAYGVADTENCG